MTANGHLIVSDDPGFPKVDWFAGQWRWRARGCRHFYAPTIRDLSAVVIYFLGDGIRQYA